jgi:hypothetical protein
MQMRKTHPSMTPAPLRAAAAATLLISAAAYAQETSLPVIPGAKGFGIMTKAGRGGPVIEVTSLLDHGPGTLREALMTAGPRTVIFEKSGTITLDTPISIRNGNLTVAGQTAPGLGILVKGRGIFILADDVLFQHIAIRPGDEPNTDPNLSAADRIKEQDNRDALDIGADPVNDNPADPANTVQRVVVDHVSLSWSVDEVFTTWGSTEPGTGWRSFVKECTISNSIFSEALNDSIHSKGPHPMGVLIGSDSTSISLHRNLMAHLGDRNPLLADDVSTVQVANNYIYRPGQAASNRMKIAVGGDFNSSMVASFKTNVMMPSNDPSLPTSSTRYGLATNRNAPQAGVPEPALTLYMDGNRIWNFPSASWWPSPITDQTNNSTVFDDHTFTGPKTYLSGPNEPSVFTTTNVNVPMIAWDQLEAYVLKNAGSRPANRDPVDARIISQVTSRTGGLINSPGPNGYPNIPVVTVSYDIPPTSTTTDSDGDGYSDLEEWLHGKAREIELGVPPPPSLTATLAAAPNNINQINLSWTNVANEDGYRIERKKGLNGTYAEIATTAADITSYNNGYLGTGTKYYYRVRAYNAKGDSGFSGDVSATTAEISGRKAHWKLDENTGVSTADSSGNGNTGTLQSGPTWVAGRIGRALSFDGSPTGGDDVVFAGSGASVLNLGAITVAAWINVETVGEAGSPGRIVHKATGTNPLNGWQFVTQGAGQLGFAVDYTGTDLVRASAANAFSLGAWHHVAVTWDGNPTAANVLMYVDGNLVGGYATSTDSVGGRVSDLNSNIYLGNAPSGDRTLDGVLDDVRVYNRALDLGEIRAIQRAGL